MKFEIENGKLIRYIESDNDKREVIIPYGVTYIGVCAFFNTKITSVTIPDSVTEIGFGAFECCKNLVTVTGYKNVNYIEGNAFEGTPWIENKQKEDPLVIINNILIDGKKCTGCVFLPDSVKMISDNAFKKNNKIVSVFIPDVVCRIGRCAFAECTELKSVTLPKGISIIDEETFADCEKLKQINIPDGVAEIGKAAFSDCKLLGKVIVPKSLKFIREYAFFNTRWLDYEMKKEPFLIINNILAFYDYFYNGSYTGDINIPEGVKCIGNNVFPRSELDLLIIPEGVTHIDDMAFFGSSISEIRFPDSLEYIGKKAFFKCSELMELVIPDSVTEIDDFAFENSEIKRLVIGKNVRRIGKGAFKGCYNLEKVEGGEAVEEISEAAFRNCKELKEITLVKKVKRIGKYAFSDCKALVSLNIPESVETICCDAYQKMLLSDKQRKENSYEKNGVQLNNAQNTEYNTNDQICEHNYNDEEDIPRSAGVKSPTSGQRFLESPLGVYSSDLKDSKKNQLSDDEIEKIIETTDSPSTLHELINNKNLCYKYDILRKALNNECCELSTALTVFGMTDGYEYLFNREAEAEDEEDKEWLKFEKELYESIINKKFKEGNIFYKPMLGYSQLMMLKRTVCFAEHIFLIPHGN